MDRHFLRRGLAGSLAAVVLSLCGCSLFPEALQPQNLQKLNRYPAPSHDPFWSIQDRMPADFQTSDPFNENADHASLNPESI